MRFYGQANDFLSALFWTEVRAGQHCPISVPSRERGLRPKARVGSNVVQAQRGPAGPRLSRRRSEVMRRVGR